jgi:hypothetical protein
MGVDPLDLIGVKKCVAPDKSQTDMMQRLTELSGIPIVQCRGTAYQLTGPRVNITHGVFAQARHNPRLKQDCIVMNTDANDSYWYSVLFHELAHASGVPKYLNREGLGGLEKTPSMYCFEELIAETVALKLTERCGFATDKTRETSEGYLKHYREAFKVYANGVPLDESKLDAEVSRAFDFVLNTWVFNYDKKPNDSRLMARLKEFNKFF